MAQHSDQHHRAINALFAKENRADQEKVMKNDEYVLDKLQQVRLPKGCILTGRLSGASM